MVVVIIGVVINHIVRHLFDMACAPRGQTSEKTSRERKASWLSTRRIRDWSVSRSRDPEAPSQGTGACAEESECKKATDDADSQGNGNSAPIQEPGYMSMRVNVILKIILQGKNPTTMLLFFFLLAEELPLSLIIREVFR